MDNWAFVNSRFDQLDRDLANAKKSPFKVRLEFDRRFKVWRDIIHRNRRLHLTAMQSDQEALLHLTQRYVSLDLYDLARLSRRAKTEFLAAADIPSLSRLSLILFQNLYHHRVSNLIEEIKYQLLSYEEITGFDIITKFSNGYIQIGGKDGNESD